MLVRPVVAIRKISSLWPLSLLGTVLVIFGVLVVFGLEVDGMLDSRGGDITLMNWKELLVCVGQACFMFEGIGLILPTYDASKNPHDFPRIFVLTQTATLCLVWCIGFFGYMAFGHLDCVRYVFGTSQVTKCTTSSSLTSRPTSWPFAGHKMV